MGVDSFWQRPIIQKTTPRLFHICSRVMLSAWGGRWSLTYFMKAVGGTNAHVFPESGRRRVVSLTYFLKADGGTKADGGKYADVFPESGRRHGRPLKV